MSHGRDSLDPTRLFRELAPKVLAAVLRRFGDFSSAEDAVQESLLAATQQWPLQGVPSNPLGWLIRVASRRMIDQLRSERARKRREETLSLNGATESGVAPEYPDKTREDDTLLLLFMCCHPALTPASAIALTLRAVGGLTTAEIASAFLVPEATMAQRISRAKQRIRDSGVPFSMTMTSDNERERRLSSVLQVLYLIFNEGYTASTGASLQRVDLACEAIRLTRQVYALLPEAGEVAGLLALMLLTDARRPARTGPNGELIPLTKQDRTLWDRKAIAEGIALVTQALSRGSVGIYQLQAAIAAVHDEAERPEDTDWPQILALYSLLRQMSDNPMVSLNHAIAAAMVHGPAKGLELLEPLDSDKRLAEHYRLDAVRGHLHEMAGNHPDAVKHYLAAASKTTSIPEQNYLRAQAALVREISSASNN